MYGLVISECQGTCPSAQQCCSAGSSQIGSASGGDLQCSHCLAGQYSETAGATSCSSCPSGMTSVKGSITCSLCSAGYASSGTDVSSLVCSPCSAGTYQDATGQASCKQCTAGNYCAAGSSSQSPCAAGSYGSDPSVACAPCPASTYSAAVGAAACTPCPAGRVSNPGSTQLIQCVNPIPNFVTGYICMGVVSFIIVFYVVYGRFHFVAFLRYRRVFSVLLEVSDAVEESLSGLISPDERHRLEDHSPHSGRGFRWIRVLVWIISSTVAFLVVVVVVYCLILFKILFSSLILWKGIHVNNLGFIDRMKEIQRTLDVLNLSVIGYLMYPFVEFTKVISSISINLGAVEVTCAGSQAPIELLIDCFVIGFVVVIIESRFFVFQKLAVQDTGLKVATTFSIEGRSVQMRSLKNYLVIITSGFVSALTFVNPLLKLLQFLMSITVIKKFISSHWTHENTSSCDIATSPGNLDFYLAKLSSFLAWCLLPPVIYMIAKVVVPVGDVEGLGTEAAAMDEAHYVHEIEISTSDWKSWFSQAPELSDYQGKKCPDDISSQ